jgi:hypothetical protein
VKYSVAGRSADTAATADHCAACLWNPHGTKSLWAREAHWFLVGATISNAAVVRTSTRGTAGSTQTPDADNDWDEPGIAPTTGALLDLAAYSAQPTVQGPYLFRGSAPAAQGAGFSWVFPEPGIEVAAGTGLAIVTPVAVILQDSDFTFVWDE